MGGRFVRRGFAAGVVCVALVGCSQEKSAEPVAQAAASKDAKLAADKTAVAQAFTAYREALVAKDGQSAAALLTADSIAYYAALKKLTLTAKEPYLRRARVSDQVAVLTLRATVPAEKLRQWSPTELAADSVRRNWVDKSTIQSVSIGEIDVMGDTGKVKMKLEGVESQSSLTFWREGGRWKFRLIPLLEATEYAMREMVRNLQMTDRQFVDQTMADALASPDKVAAAWIPAG